MLPVSGAEQLNTSDAHSMRPISSAQEAYSRLVRPGATNSKLLSTGLWPASGGMKRFHMPSAFARSFNSSIIGRVFHRRSEEQTSELQSLMRISYAVFCLKKKKKTKQSILQSKT